MRPADPIRVLVVDDEPLARAGVVDLLQTDADCEVVGEASNGKQAVKAIAALRPDLVFLDVQMPEMDGFGVIQAVGVGRMPAVVFVTAYDQYALKAFDVHAVDYLLKPFEDARFRDTITRAKVRIRHGRATDLGRKLAALLTEQGGKEGVSPNPDSTPGRLTRLVIKTGDSTHFVEIADIDWIEAADYCVRIHAGGRRHVLRESMTRLEKQLDPTRFYRIHRSAIVNLGRVREVQPYFRGDHILLLKDGTKLKLSRHRRAGLESAMRGG